MTKDQLIYQVNQLSPHGVEALLAWVATLAPNEQQMVLVWAKEQQVVLQQLIDGATGALEQFGKDLTP
jgi:hypothetical protein